MSVEDTVAGLGHLIDGQLVTTGATFDVVNPATGQVFARCPAADASLVDRAMAAAAAAQPAWAADEDLRRRTIVAMCEAIEQHYPAIDELSSLEKGFKGSGGEAYFGAVFGRHIAAEDLAVDVIADDETKTVSLVRSPVGVVAAIAPWNAPVLILAEKVFSALRVGNTVVAKPSPFTPLATLLVAKLWADLVPPGVVNVLAGGDEVGEAMVAHPTPRLISFTGSVSAGKKIAAAAAADLKNVVLELGGNDAAIVLDDVDPAAVAPRLFGAAMVGSGQVCAAVKRLYVHQSVYDRMVEELAKVASAATAAPAEEGGTMGPLGTRPQFERVRHLVDQALAEGATAVTGGAPTGQGFFYPPTILTDVAPGMAVVDEEQFGPVLPVLAFDDVDDAVAAANGTEYGLCGSVWTADVARGQALAARLECGTTWINHHTEVAPEIPFGGVKESGIGRSSGRVGLDGYAEYKTVIVYKDPARVGG